jgi:UDP-N-acetylglucosamine transferase subunit ALG13
MNEARVVVTHGGAGSVLGALAAGHRPLVVPRRAAGDEAVDDHQVDFARRLERDGLITFVDDPAELRRVVAVTTRSRDIGRTRIPRLRDELGAYLRTCVG